VRHDHFVADEPLDLAELATEPWVWTPRDIAPGYHDEVVAACRRAGFSPDASHQANSIATQPAMVSCGIGVAIVPSLVAGKRQDVTTRPLREPALLRQDHDFDLTLRLAWGYGIGHVNPHQCHSC
jgi:DNA-binding transcriptional LysR family regulator